MALGGLLLLLAGPVRALEPVNVTARGVAETSDETRATARERALAAALLAAVVEVARTLLPPEQSGLPAAALREGLDPVAAAAVLVYRIDAEPGLQRAPGTPGQEWYELQVTATVDAGQVRERLRELDLLATTTVSRPSVLVEARPLYAGSPASESALAALEHYVKARLEAAGFAIVEPALRDTPTSAGEGPVERARALGADLGIELAVGWLERGIADRIVGGVAEVRMRAQRARDGLELATSRYEVPAYHEDPLEAQARAMETVQEQVAENLILQLERNWEALEPGERSLVLALSNVSSFGQVERVREALAQSLVGARIDIRLLAPRSAELVIRAPLSPGGLQERLLALPFEGFRLEAADLGIDRVGLRLVPLDPLPSADEAVD